MAKNKSTGLEQPSTKARRVSYGRINHLIRFLTRLLELKIELDPEEDPAFIMHGQNGWRRYVRLYTPKEKYGGPERPKRK